MIKSIIFIKITQIKSTIGRNKAQKNNLIALGLKKIRSSKSIIININCNIINIPKNT